MSASRFDQGDAEQPISVMMHGTKSSENDRCTFGGSDQTPSLSVEAVATVVAAVVVDDMVTCIEV